MRLTGHVMYLSIILYVTVKGFDAEYRKVAKLHFRSRLHAEFYHLNYYTIVIITLSFYVTSPKKDNFFNVNYVLRQVNMQMNLSE